ncbi:MAG TPA: M13-type metalloendopeptidase [Actinomycetales bacterium]|nr:M13-type metalloendopeptidase [Actinomycetales bacterium]
MKSGIDTAPVDSTIRPQDDLFRHVNGTWLKNVEIPDDRATYGAFVVLVEEAEQAVREIIEKAAESCTVSGGEKRQAADDEHQQATAQKIGQLYLSFMAEDDVDALGGTPIANDISRIQSIKTIADFIATLGEFERDGVGSALAFGVDTDPGDPNRYIVRMVQGGLGLPDESYYREPDAAQLREEYEKHVAKMLSLVGLSEPELRAQRVLELETSLARAHWDQVRSRDASETFNPMDRDRLEEIAPQFPWRLWLEHMGAPEHTLDAIVVHQPDFFSALSDHLVEEQLPAWLDWLAFNVVSSAAPYLSGEFVAANFDFYGRKLSGVPQLRERWKRGVSLVEGGLGEAVGELYVAKHFPPSHKERMQVLVENLIEAYRRNISKLPWMTQETREKALEKLEKFTPKIGYPDKWRDYSGLDIRVDDLLGNVRRITAFELERELRKLGGPVDRDEWFMTPQTVNAYYNPGMNEIVFPAAILQPPFFDADAEDAINYGGIGAVIGHEIGHGFDDQGSKYDGDGALRDWWTDEDRAAFEERTKALIAQYDALEPAQLPGENVNGALTIGENIGDLGGLTIAWQGYLISLEDAKGERASLPELDNMSAAERFLFQWARVWSGKVRDEELRRRLVTDPHSPGEFRANQVVRNFDLFHETFAVTPEDEMWMAPEERVRIW